MSGFQETSQQAFNRCDTTETNVKLYGRVKRKRYQARFWRQKYSYFLCAKRKNEGMEIHLTMSCLKNYNKNQCFFFQPMRISCKDDKNKVRVSPATFDRSRQYAQHLAHWQQGLRRGSPAIKSKICSLVKLSNANLTPVV